MEKYDDVLMSNALSWGKEAKCRSIQVGAILAVEGRTIMSGYNGTVAGSDNCCEENNTSMDPVDKTKKPGIIHAELNAIAFCAKKGISTEGATLYVSYSPCVWCAPIIAQVGIKRVVFEKLFKDTSGIEDLKRYGIEVEQYVQPNKRLKQWRKEHK